MLGTKRKVISLAFHFDCKPAPSAPIPLAGFFLLPNLGRGFATGCAREPLKLALPAVLYDAPLHGAVMAQDMTGSTTRATR